MTDIRRCPQCGAPLADQTAQGLCPACLVKVGMASQSLSVSELGGGAEAESGLAATLTHAPERDAAQVAPRREVRLPEPGEQFGDYQIVRTLGRGGMGAVYEAEQLSTGRRLALKVLKHSLDSADARKRFIREGRLAAAINHPNSVYVFGTEEIDGTPAITMELVAGGTLQERVKKQGPLPVGEAVDIILQIIAGLEAAQRLGVLHRDIKPANCFVDANGAVKVGDFGLSISTAPRGDSDVTHSGSFLGTPAFASPEQLRGDELNVRSDMYSVGVTLYYLLTGRTPFNADNLVKLLATVLERPAESPKKWRRDMPQGLAAIVIRCLEKQPTDRFKTYDELRQALTPYSSTAPTPAPLGFRFVAKVIDQILWVVVFWCLVLALPSSWGLSPFSGVATRPGLPAFCYFLVTFALVVLFFAIPEGRWGLTAGKWLCRLRVVNDRREAPGFAKALSRAVLIASVSAPQSILYCLFPMATLQPYQWPILLGQWVCYALIFSTARTRNGLAGVHDLLTGTRVILLPPRQVRPALADGEESLPATQTATIGPYHVLDVLEKQNGEEWILGYDTRLLRRVWIHEQPMGAEPITASLRNVARAGRVRWLNGRRSSAENWDAYEALTGEPLVKILGRRWPWETVRFWLLDLAEELEAAAKDQTLPESLRLDRVWITADGRAKLLDFIPPGLTIDNTNQSAARLDSRDPLVRRQFLNQVSIAALEGAEIDPTEASTRSAHVPAPVAARRLLDHLAQPGDDYLAAQLRPLTQQSATVSRRRRVATVLASCLPAVFIGIVVTSTWWLFTTFNRMEPDVMALQSNLVTLDQLKTGKHEEHQPTPEDIRAVEIYIVRHYHDTITNPNRLSGPIAQGLFDEPKRRELARLVADHPHPTDEDVKAAENNPLVQQLHEGMEMGFGFFNKALDLMIFFGPLSGLEFVALASCLSALLFRRGLFLRTLGIDIVTADGSLASRGRALWRSVITWSPMLVSPIVIALLTPLVQEKLSVAWLALFPLAYLALVVWSLALPDRGLPDRLAGTWLVPE